VTSNNSSFATQASDEKPPRSKELAERRTEYGVVWIMYMRFGRRAEGLQSSRTIFGRARKDRWTPWEVYEAAGKATRRLPGTWFILFISALVEYHCTKSMDVASRIFEKGLQLFGEETEYVLRYLGFLISVNDENS
jgi:cleavage stimulation factor subunit 3